MSSPPFIVRLQIREQLLLLHRRGNLDGFDLYNHLVLQLIL